MVGPLFLSHPLNGQTPAYGGGAPVRIDCVKSIAAGDSANTQQWAMPNHIGTHADAPLHFFDGGRDIASYPPEFWICTHVAVAEIPLDASRWITESDMPASIPPGTECLLIKTGYQKWRGTPQYTADNPGLAPELAAWLRARFPGLRFVGMDFISISRITDRERGRAAHREFLRPAPPGHPILPVEDMDLSGIAATSVIRRLGIVPLRVEGADGAPVTVVAELA